MDKRDRLNELLGDLCGAVLTVYEVDLFRNKVKLNFECREHDNTEFCTVTFEKVSSIYYGEEPRENRLKIEEVDMDYFDLHTVDFYPKEERSKVEILSDTSLKSYYFYPNFVFEIKFDAVLLVEAQIVTINGEKFTDLV